MRWHRLMWRLRRRVKRTVWAVALVVTAMVAAASLSPTAWRDVEEMTHRHVGPLVDFARRAAWNGKWGADDERVDDGRPRIVRGPSDRSGPVQRSGQARVIDVDTLDFERPRIVRGRQPALAAGDARGGCNIKGNVSYISGQRIYHRPGDRYYDRTRIRPSRGERWFCSESEAREAGWRRPRR